MNLHFPPLYDYQIEFLETTSRYVGFMGGRGSGKSFVSPMKGLFYALKYPGALAIMTAPTYKQVKEIVFEPLLSHVEMLPKEMCKVTGGTNGADFAFENKSKILTRSLQNMGHLKSINASYVSGDEFQEIPIKDQEKTFREMRLLLRSPLNYPEQLVLTFNPTGENSPLYNFFERDKGIDADLKWFRSLDSRENKDLSDEYIRELEKLPKDIRESYLEGRWQRQAGAIFSIKNGVHVIDKPLIDTEYYLSFDWGYYDAFVCLLIQSSKGMIHVLDEVYMVETETKELIPMVHNMLIKNGVTTLKAMCGDNSEPDSLLLWSNELSKYNPSKRSLPIVGTLKWRKKGALAILECLNDLDTGRARLTISEKCVKLIYSLVQMVWNENTREPGEGDDHGFDALKYFVMSQVYLKYIKFLKELKL